MGQGRRGLDDQHVLMDNRTPGAFPVRRTSTPHGTALMTVLMIYNSPENVGDRNQAFAVARVLANGLSTPGGAVSIATACINARYKVKPLIPLLKRTGFLRAVGPFGPAARLWHRLFTTEDPIAPDTTLIVSRLGKAEHASVALAAYLGVPNVHVGEPARVPESLFSLIVSTSDTREAANRVFLETVPSHLFPEDLARESEALRSRPGFPAAQPVWCLLVGGNADGYHYTGEDWAALGRLVQQLTRQHGIRWVISTSRRTGRDAEDALRRAMGGQEMVADATWWSREPRATLPAYIGASEACIVTADSQSMISNCVAAGRPVYAFAPAGSAALDQEIESSPEHVRIHRFLRRLSTNRRIQVLSPQECTGPRLLDQARGELRLVTEQERWDVQLLNKARAMGLIPGRT